MLNTFMYSKTCEMQLQQSILVYYIAVKLIKCIPIPAIVSIFVLKQVSSSEVISGMQYFNYYSYKSREAKHKAK